eukprot:3991190-Amphidinium_carterae.1
MFGELGDLPYQAFHKTRLPLQIGIDESLTAGQKGNSGSGRCVLVSKRDLLPPPPLLTTHTLSEAAM